jgi:glucose-1-phosphatase
MAKALLFDIGNVLVTFDFAPCAQALAEHSDLAPAEILSVIQPWKDPFESGQLEAAHFVTQCMQSIGYRGSEEQFIHAWCHIFTPHLPMWQTLEQLGGELPLYLLSNTNSLHKDFLLREFSVFRHFSGGIYSHEAQSMKPDHSIYQQAIQTYGLIPEHTLYIDDLSANIAAGQALGFMCHHYDPAQHTRFEADLQRWLAQR